MPGCGVGVSSIGNYIPNIVLVSVALICNKVLKTEPAESVVSVECYREVRELKKCYPVGSVAFCFFGTINGKQDQTFNNDRGSNHKHPENMGVGSWGFLSRCLQDTVATRVGGKRSCRVWWQVGGNIV